MWPMSFTVSAACIDHRRLVRSIAGLALIALGLLASCHPATPDRSSAPGATPSSEPPSIATARPSATATATAIPHLVLGVPPEQAELAAAALAEFQASQADLEIQPISTSLVEESLIRGEIDLALMPDSAGTAVTSQPLALAVPWDSDWGDLSLAEAQQVIEQGSAFIAVLDWRDMTPGLRALHVDGLHPGENGYPVLRNWSLHARPGLEGVAATLAPLLATHMQDEPVVRLAVVGDLMLDRTLGVMVSAGELDFPFRLLGPELAEADLAVGNLESALGSGGHPESKGYTFRAPPAAAESLAMAGFDLLSLANNHAMDFGPSTLLQAIELLGQQGIAVIGAGADDASAHQPVVCEVNGLRLAFLAYVDVPQEYRGFDARAWQAGADTPGVAWADPARIRADVGAARAGADLVIVVLHSGYEYVPAPSPVQVAAARAAVEAGADLVLGHHAHLLQGVERYQDGVIAYGLGNFAFEDAGPPESGVLQVWLDAGGVRAYDLVPVILDEFGRPGPADDARRDEIRALFRERSRALQQP